MTRITGRVKVRILYLVFIVHRFKMKPTTGAFMSIDRAEFRKKVIVICR